MKLIAPQMTIEYINYLSIITSNPGKWGGNVTLNSFNCFRVKADTLWPPKILHIYVREIFNLILMLELPILHM